jgi:glycolate oxidase FAD binding subunit
VRREAGRIYSASFRDGRRGGALLSKVIAPGSPEELANELASANASHLAVIPCGGGTKGDWGNPPTRADVTLSTLRLNRVIEHAWADLTVTVEAGCTVGALQRALAQHGQRLAVDPLWPDRATIGGILATNDSGALRLRYGGLRDLIIGITLALPDGTLAESGGKVVKNVAGYDLPKLATGSLGTLGVITRAVFRLHPLAHHARTLTILVPNIQVAQQVMLDIQSSRLAHTALQVRVDETSQPKVDVLLEGTEAGIAAQAATVNEIAPGSPGDPAVWNARQELWPPPNGATIVKFGTLPTGSAQTLDAVRGASIRWSAVVQATGIGYVRLNADLQDLRAGLEQEGGSLVILGKHSLDAWGSVGDTLPLMRALKQQLDPQGTLNPGRFAGGI